MSNMKIVGSEIEQDAQTFDRCGDRYVQIFQEFRSIINSLREEKILSSQLIDREMESTLSRLDEISKRLREDCTKFKEFLQVDVVRQYQELDEERAKKFDVNEGERLV